LAAAPPQSSHRPLQKTVIVDNSVLSNFVDAGLSDLLYQLAGGPIYIAPSVLDPMELPPYSGQPRAEFAKGLFKAGFKKADSRMARRYFNRMDFVKQHGVLWQPAQLNLVTFRKRLEIEQMAAQPSPQDAESLAFAKLNDWVLLTDDSPLATLAEEMGVTVFRTCSLLVLAVKNGLIECFAAANSFNQVMVDEMGFYVHRNQRKERLYFRCDPPRCEWVWLDPL